MAKQDFYEILGVGRTADAEELKRAYRKLAMQYHPDRNSGEKVAEQKFKDISEAYDVLKDDQKRAAYDRFGHAAFENGSRGPGDFGFGAGFSGGFADIFEEMFGAMGGARRAPGGAARSLYLCRDQPAPDLSARRSQHLLPRADPVHDRGVGRDDRSADGRGQQDPRQCPGRDPVAAPVPPARQGDDGAARGHAGR